jgi:hypothetical protein
VRLPRRARLRKYVVTEQVTTTARVSHEDGRIEREPITDANRDPAMAGSDIAEEEHEVTLHGEQRSCKGGGEGRARVPRQGTVTEQQGVTEQVRKEQIDTPNVDGAPGIRADR